MAREKKPEEVKGGCPEWLATYGDMVTLVLTFFVLLFSMSSIDAEKWKAAAISLSGMPGIFDGTVTTTKLGAEPALPPGIADLDVDDLEDMMSSDEWEDLVEVVRGMMQQETLAGMATMEADEGQVKITLSGDVLFDSGKAVLKEGSAEVLVDVVHQIYELHQEDRINLDLVESFKIEGHTDTVPQRSAQYPDNWWLSSARALVVRDFLEKNFPPEEYPELRSSIYSAEGRGEYHPVGGADIEESNSTPEGRAKNRRVEFYIMRNMSYRPGADDYA